MPWRSTGEWRYSSTHPYLGASGQEWSVSRHGCSTSGKDPRRY